METAEELLITALEWLDRVAEQVAYETLDDWRPVGAPTLDEMWELSERLTGGIHGRKKN